MGTWAVARAKAQFSELIESAREHGVQEITRNGKLVGMLVSPEEWELKTGPRTGQNARTMSEFFRNSPLVDSGIVVRRSSSKARKVQL